MKLRHFALLLVVLALAISCRNSAPQAPAPDVPDVPAAPIVVTPPIVPPVAPPVSPPEGLSEILPRSLHVFCEAGDAAGKDFFFRAAGIDPARCYAHAIRGKSAYAKTIRLAHVWYDPWKTSLPEATMADFVSKWVAQAKREGCVGVSLDHEGWTVVKRERLLALLYSAAHAHGMFFVNVPKAAFAHVLVHDKPDDWAWPYRFGFTPEQCATLINDTTDANLFWDYSADVGDWAAATTYVRGLGYKKQSICLLDGISTRTLPRHTALLTTEILKTQSSIGFFNPDIAAPEVISAIRAALK
jgi:hypothetical protein